MKSILQLNLHPLDISIGKHIPIPAHWNVRPMSNWAHGRWSTWALGLSKTSIKYGVHAGHNCVMLSSYEGGHRNLFLSTTEEFLAWLGILLGKPANR